MMPCRGLSDSLKGISYSPHEYLYSWGPRITGFPEGKTAEMTSELAAGPYEAPKKKTLS